MTFQTVIIDEGHRASNVRTKTYKTLRKLTQDVEYKIINTATPLMNKPPDLYGVLNLIKPGYLGGWWQFMEKYTIRNKWGGFLFPINQEDLAQKVKKLIVRKSLEEVAPQLPTMTIEDIPFDLSTKERKLYDQLKEEILFAVKENLVNKIENPMIIQQTLVKMIVLTELTCSLELLGEDRTSTKMDILKERLEDILSGNNKVIIFSRFKKMANILHRELSDYKPLLITGDVTGADRDKAVQKFQKDDSRKLLVSTDAGGEGLNLDSSNIIFHYDLPLSYGKYIQRNGRIKRLTQQKPMIVYRLIARKSMDTYIARNLHRKSQLSDAILGKSTTLSDIKEMLT